jgi:two-component system LytT family response regulator
MKAVLIDDERLARVELRLLLSAHPEIQIVGEADSVSLARELIGKETPDVIFLDINLRGESGFDLLEALPLPHPQVIFSTAYDEYALRAFEVNAMDYLLKPIHPERLAAAVERLGAAGTKIPAEPGDGEPRLGRTSRFFVRDGDRCWFVSVEDLYLIEAEGNYSRLHFGREQALVYRSLSSLEKRLPTDVFLRANRSQMINCDYVAGLEPWFSQTLRATLKDGHCIEFSRRASLLFRERMSL